MKLKSKQIKNMEKVSKQTNKTKTNVFLTKLMASPVAPITVLSEIKFICWQPIANHNNAVLCEPVDQEYSFSSQVNHLSRIIMKNVTPPQDFFFYIPVQNAITNLSQI